MAKKSEGFCTTRCQLFNTEMTNNENKLRMRWFANNRQLLLDHLRDDKLVMRAREMRDKLVENRRQRFHENEQDIDENKHSLPVWRPPNDDGTINFDTMKPVDPSTRAIIYEHGVESFLSGRNYLQQRYKAKPENRFYHPDCTSWLYGWRLADYVPVKNKKSDENSSTSQNFNQRRTSNLPQSHSNSQCQCQTTNAKKKQKKN